MDGLFGTPNENINTEVPEKYKYKYKYIWTNTVEELRWHDCENCANKVDELFGKPNENIYTKVVHFQIQIQMERTQLGELCKHSGQKNTNTNKL